MKPILYGPNGRALPRINKRFVAGKNFNTTVGWNPIRQDMNSKISQYGYTVAQRIKHLVRNFPYFKRAKKKHIDYSVTNGYNLQSQVKKTNGDLNKTINDKIEDAWKIFIKKIDISNKMNIHQMQRLCGSYDFENGEFILIKHLGNNKKFIPLEYQVIDPSRLGCYEKTYDKNISISNGVEYNKFTNESLNYYFSDVDDFVNYQKVSAKFVIHGFETIEAGQLRGISPIVCAVLLANDMRNRIDTELELANMAAKWLAFIETDNMDSMVDSWGSDTDEQSDQTIESIQNGQIEYLRKGEKMNLNSVDRPGAGFEAFMKLTCRMIAIASNISYEILSGDYSGISWSNLRGIRLDLQSDFEPIQERYTEQFNQKIYEDFLEIAVLSGRLNLPGYWENPYKYTQARWLPMTSIKSVDALRDSKSKEVEYDNYSRSPIEDILARGRDPEEVLDECAKWKEGLDTRGLVDKDVKTFLKNNPSSLGANDGDLK